MNIRRAAHKLEKFYEESKDSMPLTVLKNGAVGYKDYVVKKSSDDYWELYKCFGKKFRFVEKFNLKSSAVMAAKHYDRNYIKGILEVRSLDSGYWRNHMDSVIFKDLYSRTTDSVKKDTFLWRWEITKCRADYYKQKITSAFTTAFR